jgi:LuxR family maltose regulon positive regulatory protein
MSPWVAIRGRIVRQSIISSDVTHRPVRGETSTAGELHPGRCRHLIELIERATRRRVTLVCAPRGTGKTLACSLWAVGQLSSLVVWLTLSADDDPSLFWAGMYHGLMRAAAAPVDAMQMLAEATAAEFPLWLSEAARWFVTPVVIVIDNAHDATSNLVLTGLDLLLGNAPPNLRIVLAGRDRPQLRQLARLQASGDVTIIGPADLACAAALLPRGGSSYGRR